MFRQPGPLSRLSTSATHIALLARSLEQLHEIAVPILQQDLLPAMSHADVVAEVEAGKLHFRHSDTRSSTSTTKRFHPPRSGRRPSGMGRAAELCGPASQSVSSLFETRYSICVAI